MDSTFQFFPFIILRIPMHRKIIEFYLGRLAFGVGLERIKSIFMRYLYFVGFAPK